MLEEGNLIVIELCALLKAHSSTKKRSKRGLQLIASSRQGKPSKRDTKRREAALDKALELALAPLEVGHPMHRHSKNHQEKDP